MPAAIFNDFAGLVWLGTGGAAITLSGLPSLRGHRRMRSVYISITGFRLIGWWHWPRFWWHTLRSIAQARRAHGNLRVEARIINGVHYTLTVWTDERAMRTFLTVGAHLGAMKAYRSLGSGRTLGFNAHRPPDWEAALHRWIAEAREV